MKKIVLIVFVLALSVSLIATVTEAKENNIYIKNNPNGDYRATCAIDPQGFLHIMAYNKTGLAGTLKITPELLTKNPIVIKIKVKNGFLFFSRKRYVEFKIEWKVSGDKNKIHYKISARTTLS